MKIWYIPYSEYGGCISKCGFIKSWGEPVAILYDCKFKYMKFTDSLSGEKVYAKIYDSYGNFITKELFEDTTDWIRINVPTGGMVYLFYDSSTPPPLCGVDAHLMYANDNEFGGIDALNYEPEIEGFQEFGCLKVEEGTYASKIYLKIPDTTVKLQCQFSKDHVSNPMKTFTAWLINGDPVSKYIGIQGKFKLSGDTWVERSSSMDYDVDEWGDGTMEWWTDEGSSTSLVEIMIRPNVIIPKEGKDVTLKFTATLKGGATELYEMNVKIKKDKKNKIIVTQY